MKYSTTLALLVFAVLIQYSLLADEQRGSQQEPRYLEMAKETARWMRAGAMKTEQGVQWPNVPGDAKSISNGLYSGVVGQMVFFLELYQATKNRDDLAEAIARADYLVKNLSSEKDCGLYTGLAGMGFVLLETAKVTNEARFADAARECVGLLKVRAKKVGKGVEWSDSTDIISGSAGIGLFLLAYARTEKDDSARELARLAGDRLCELGKPAEGGIKWAMSPGFNRLMPNFSHGTAGVAFFLATLHQETNHQPFLDAALGGAKYLQAIAQKEQGGCLIFHHEPGGEKLFYLGWCHGPVGTARLFYRLHQITGEQAWMEWVERGAQSIMLSGIPKQRTPGFWNNTGLCCGSAGVAEFFLDLHRVTKKPVYLTFAKTIMEELVGQARRESTGVSWPLAEHRVKPELVTTQSGYMQGAAGIGACLVRFHQFAKGEKGRVVLPDCPF